MTGSRARSRLGSRQGLVHPSGSAQVVNRKVRINMNVVVLSFVVGGREDMGIEYGTKGMIFKECGLRR